jgi:hypothetical protein
MRLAMVSCASVVWNIVLTDPVMGVDDVVSGVVDWRTGSRVQRPLVASDLVPVSRTRSSRVIVTPVWVKTALHP